MLLLIKNIKRVFISVDHLSYGFKHFKPKHFAPEKRYLRDRDGCERVLNLLNIFVLNCFPFAHVLSVNFINKDPVDDHLINSDTVEVEVGKRTHRLFDHHLFGVHDQTYGGFCSIRQEIDDAVN